MNILIVGDSFSPASVTVPAFAELEGHTLTAVDLEDEPSWQPTSPSETSLKEYLGSPAQVIAAIDDHDVLVVQAAPITDAVLAAAPRLKLICVARGGPVNVDLAAATARGIPVVTTPGKNATAVAELTIASMVMLARRVIECMRHVESGGEVYVNNYEGMDWTGHDLAGHTLGLIGFGQVGRRVATRAAAFDMHILVSDPYVEPELVRAVGADVVELDRLLSESDYVSLHARATDETRGMLGVAQFERMKMGAYLINTGRDVLIDEAALIGALRANHLAGAMVDIASPSPAGQRHPLLQTPNVIVLPHIGGATVETLTNGARMVAQEVDRFVAGLPLANVANRAVLGSA